MVLLLILIIFMTVCGTKSFPLRFSMDIPQEPIRQKVFENDLSSNSMNGIYDTYYSLTDKKEEGQLNIIPQTQIDRNNIKISHFYGVTGDTYLFVKSMRHRDKRYSSYLTLCPFKICNMGRKRTRTRRYIQMIRNTDDNEES